MYFTVQPANLIKAPRGQAPVSQFALTPPPLFGSGSTSSSPQPESEPIMDTFERLLRSLKQSFQITKNHLGGIWTWPRVLAKHTEGHEASFLGFTDPYRFGYQLVAADMEAAYADLNEQLEGPAEKRSSAASEELSDLREDARKRRYNVLIEYPALVMAATTEGNDKISNLVRATIETGSLHTLQSDVTNSDDRTKGFKALSTKLRHQLDSMGS